jgi:hypothetical protein
MPGTAAWPRTAGPRCRPERHGPGARFADDGVSAIVYTDIARDGMMQGVNVEATVDVARAGGFR